MGRTARLAHGGRRGAALACTLACAAAVGAIAEARAAEPSRHEVLAAVIFKLAGFVEWPASAPAGYALCAYGEVPLVAALDAYVGRPARGGAVSVRRLARGEVAPGCHVALVSGEDPRLVEQVAETWRGRPVLVVGEGDGAVDRGAMVGLAVPRDRVVFDADLSAASREGLVQSSKLIRLARRVK